MAEFLVVFVVTLLVIGGVTLALVFGKAPIYRPDTEHIESLLTRLLDGQLPDQEWQFFLDMPIQHDPTLDNIRQRCKEVAEKHSLRSRNDKARLKEEGLIRVRHLLGQLEKGGSRSF